MLVPLSRRLILEARQLTADGAGGFHETWTELGNHWAEIRPGSGRERTGQAGALSSQAMRITVRAAPDGTDARPQVDQRFREGSRVYRITAVSERDPQGKYLQCAAFEEISA